LLAASRSKTMPFANEKRIHNIAQGGASNIQSLSATDIVNDCFRRLGDEVNFLRPLRAAPDPLFSIKSVIKNKAVINWGGKPLPEKVSYLSR
jgi:hypothetical protein